MPAVVAAREEKCDKERGLEKMMVVRRKKQAALISSTCFPSACLPRPPSAA